MQHQDDEQRDEQSADDIFGASHKLMFAGVIVGCVSTHWSFVNRLVTQDDSLEITDFAADSAPYVRARFSWLQPLVPPRPVQKRPDNSSRMTNAFACLT